MTEEEINEVYEKAFEIAYGSNRVLLLNDPVIDAISKEVKKALGNDLVSRIEHLDRNKAIMIVCGDDHLTKGIVDYIWYTHPTKLVRRNTGLCPAYIGLRHRSYSRWTEEQVALDIRGWEISLKEVYFGTHDYKYKWDYIQFLQNVTGGYQEVFKRLLNLARDYKLGNERMLIVSTDKVDALPKNLSEQFEIVKPNLETEKQIINKDTSTEIIPVPTPEGVRWDEVSITFTDNDHVKTKVRDVVKTLHYSQMGFKHEQTKKAIKPWNTLRIFAMKNGTVSYQITNIKKGETVSKKSERLVTQDDVKELKRKLCEYFKTTIEDNPIPYDKENSAYKTLFQIKDDTEAKKNFINKPDNHDNDEREDRFSGDSNDT